jgi:rhamnose transport system ATP-binding protein
MTTLLSLTGVHKSFAGARALRGVSFDLRPDEVHALVGENGAGKSTLVKIITGAIQPDAGTLAIRGAIITDNDPSRARELGVAVIYQQPALFPDLTIAENIALGLETVGPWRYVNWRARRDRARQLLARIGAAIGPDTPVGRLSMPEQQLVEIARALGADARILIMDEPTASLSEAETANLFRVIGELRSDGVGIIYISHRLEELSLVADRVTVLRDGEVVDTRSMAGVTRAELTRLMVGRELSAVFPKQSVPIGEVVLELRGVGCRSGGVRDVNLTVRAGEIVGLSGLIGAGGTELARVVFGLTPADAGEIILRNKSVVVDKPSRAVEFGIAYVPEDRRQHGVILDMAVAANTTLATLRRISTLGLLDFGRERAVAGDYVRRLGIKTASIDAAVGTLSGGNQQKVAVARWLATDPAVLILDEPTQGVDVGAKAEIHRLMGELAGRGIAILMISSELPEVLGMSDRIAVMHGGTIVGTLDRADATQEAVMELSLGHSLLSPSPASGEDRGGGSGVNPLPNPPPKRGREQEYLRELSVAAVYGVLLLALACIAPSFFRDQFRATLVSAAPVLIAAVGMTLVILTRHIDISIGSTVSVCGVVAGLLAREGVPMPAALVLTLAAGGLIGAVNGAFVAGLGLPSIVVTLATMVTLRESLRWAREGEVVRGLPPGFQWFGLGQSLGQWVILGIAIVVFLKFAWVLRYLTGGRAVYATGSDPEAARLAGLRPRRVVFGVFVLMGALAALAALLGAVCLPDIDPNAGTGLELKVIAAVVVGGTAVTGGRGTLIGTLIGVALLATIGPALVFLGATPQWERAIQGAIILAAVASDGLRRKGGHQ